MKDGKTDENGNFLANEILLRLPASELQQLYPKLEFMRLKLHTVLHDAGDQIKSVYFVNTGMQSILAVQPVARAWKWV